MEIFILICVVLFIGFIHEGIENDNLKYLMKKEYKIKLYNSGSPDIPSWYLYKAPDEDTWRTLNDSVRRQRLLDERDRLNIKETTQSSEK